MEINKIIGLIISICLIFVISFTLICCLGFHKIFKVHPENNNNNNNYNI